ncbi:hypothetical protein EV127DRAFT_498605 [Xylaria flabelliformis]|nr:hypothetical protein EV127DRAFT_498605 [Xylaria flabelliformis]
MDKLSPEIVDLIVSFLSNDELPDIATVSRMFQRSVEMRTFKKIIIRTEGAGIHEFERIWRLERRPVLRNLIIDLAVQKSYCEDLPMPKKHSRVDTTATLAPLRRLWDFLSSAWAETALERRNVTLTLTNSGRCDPPRQVRLERPRPDNVQYPPLSAIDLIADAEDLPALPFVRSFELKPGWYYWHPRMGVILASSMPNLESVWWQLDNAGPCQWGHYYSIDKQCRDELVQVIKAKRLPSSVKDFRFHLKRPIILLPTHALPRLIEIGKPDPLSHAMRELTRHCDQIHLSGSFGPSLFDPPNAGPAEQLCWQSTTRLLVEMAIYYPDGSWLLQTEGSNHFDLNLDECVLDCTQLPPGYGDTKEERVAAFEYFNDHLQLMETGCGYEPRYTLVPDNEKLNILLVAFARCCARMPALEVAQVELNVKSMFQLRYGVYSDDFPFAVACVAPFCRPSWEGGEKYLSSSWTVLLQVHDWRPTSATITELEYIGVVKDGQPSIISYIEVFQWEHADSQESFKRHQHSRRLPRRLPRQRPRQYTQ